MSTQIDSAQIRSAGAASTEATSATSADAASTTTGTVRTTGHFTFAGWEERALTASETSPKLAHASVTNTFTGGIEVTDTICEYSIVYTTETTGSFTGMEVITGRLDGREGTFAVEERGRFGADGAVHCTFEVVSGSGTGALTGLRGTGRFTFTPGESSVPYTFDYGLE